MVISRTKIHIFDMEIKEAHQKGTHIHHLLWLKQISFFYRETASAHFGWNNVGVAPGAGV